MDLQSPYNSGDKIKGRFLVHKVLNGGMGEVYLCLDLKTDYPYALKTIQQHLLSNKAIQDAFEHEVDTWIALGRHPHIVQCHVMQRIENQPYMFLEWVMNGNEYSSDLRSRLRQGAVSIHTALEITIGICRGLRYANETISGIVHRDLKPENILLTQRDFPKITDFGLATVIENRGIELFSTVHASSIAGTPLYMAPEQWQGIALDTRTDIYAIGLILIEMITGRHPLSMQLGAPTLANVRSWHMEGTVSSILESMPVELATVLKGCIASKPFDRYTSAAELCDQLIEAYQKLFGILPREEPTSEELSSNSYTNRGITYYYLNKENEAFVNFDKAIEVDPKNTWAYLCRAAAHRDSDRYEEALTDYSTPIALNTGMLQEAYTERASTYIELNQTENAFADLSKAIELDPTDANPYRFRGFLYLRLEKYENALRDLTLAIELNPVKAEIYHHRAQAYFSLNQYENAFADYEMAIELDPKDAVMYHNRGNAYNRMQRFEKALADFKRAIELDPDFTEAYFIAGMTLVSRSALEEAIPYFDKAALLGHRQAREFAVKARSFMDS